MPTIRELRVRQGMSQKELAVAIGVSEQTINRLETGKSARKSTIVAVCRALYTTMDHVEGYSLFDPIAAQNKGKIRQ